MRCCNRGFAWLVMAALAVSGVQYSAPLLASELEWLTRDGRLKQNPVFTAAGSELVYAVAESPTLLRLMRIKLADGSVEPLHSEPSTSEFQPAFSADERYRVFVQQSGVTRVKLVIRDKRDGGEAIFDPGGDRNHLGCPSIAPDASRVIFSFPTAGGQQIVSVDMQAGDLKLLTQTSGINDWPVFSSDGKRIAFASSREGDFEIYVMQADGSDVRRLTNSAGMDIRPSWSPDGERLAFTSTRDGDYEIYIVEADGTGLRRVTNHPERDDFAVWHPDGRRLVMVAQRSGRCDLALIDVNELLAE